ncbi:hypothetical protein evm_010347 [Chilo suppressalis]|nr:hypothetical protein evm_010347 [Chilo suppressalis]
MHCIQGGGGVSEGGGVRIGDSRVEMLMDALISVIIDAPVTDNTYYLHLECINTLLVLMSVYMFANMHGQESLVETSLIYRSIYQGRYGMHAPLLVKTLLQNLSSMLPAPPQMFGTAAPGGSLLINIAFPRDPALVIPLGAGLEKGAGSRNTEISEYRDWKPYFIALDTRTTVHILTIHYSKLAKNKPINVPTAGVQTFPMDGIGRLGHDPPRGPSADWWVLATADAAGTNGLTCLPKHGGARDSKFWSPIQ